MTSTMKLPNGKYRTANGSTMEISGTRGGISRVDFDWLEEGACLDCRVRAYEHDGNMIWECDYCDGGRTPLFPVTPGSAPTERDK